MTKRLWSAPPGAPMRRAGAVRKVFASFVVGVLCVGVAWAGAGLVPVGEVDTRAIGDGAPKTGSAGRAVPAAAIDPAAEPESFAMPTLTPGQFYGGAAKVSIKPRPADYGGRWETDRNKCENLESEAGVREGLSNASDLRVVWAENPSCIFMGGYGLGPMNPIVAWDDEYGLWSRSVAFSDGADTIVLTLIDAVYWEAYYDRLCDGCGFLELADRLAAETGLRPESFIFASTHSHTAPDFIGGWGGVPRWYMQQATDALVTSVKASLASLRPALLEMGEVVVRDRNAERRDYYRSAEVDGLSWFRLIDASNQPQPATCYTPSPSPNNSGSGNGFGNAGKQPEPTPICEAAQPGQAIATVGAYAAHPVTTNAASGVGDADFPAVFARRAEEAFGGVGMFLQTGLGNMSPRGSKIEMGSGLAAAIPPLGSGTPVTNTDVRAGRTFWDQPVTNVPLGHLGAAGVFDRTFNKTPAAVHEGKSSYPHRKCSSASHLSVRTSVSAVKVGPLWITGGPGELFANLTNTIEERNANGVTLALGLVNDGLGYIVQSFETDHVGRQGAGFVGGPLAEYEDAYSIDHCFGDAVLEKTIALLGTL